MKAMKTYNRISGLFWFVISIFVCYKSLQVEVGTIRSPGAGFVPFWVGVIFALLSAVLFAMSFHLMENTDREIPDRRETNCSRVLVFLLVLFLYVLLFQKIGYLLSTFGLMLCLLSISEKMMWWIRVLSSIFISISTYVLFKTWLNVQLPGGVLE